MQKQALARNAQVAAWLQSGDVPDFVRERELANLDTERERITPLPVPLDEVPLSPPAQIGRQAFLDQQGEWGAPGTTWVFNPKLRQWAPDRNAPNNNLDYMRAEQDGQDQAGGEDQLPAPSLQEAVIAGMAVGHPGHRLGQKPQDHIRYRQAEQQMEQKAEAHQLKMREAAVKETEAKQRPAQVERERISALYDKGYSEALSAAAKAHKTEGLGATEFAPNQNALHEAAMAYVERHENLHRVPEYLKYTKSRFIGVPDGELPDNPDGRAEQLRRKKGRGARPEVPVDWEPGQVPFPAAAHGKLGTDLVALNKWVGQVHAAIARGDNIPTRVEWMRDGKPLGDYGAFTQLMRWALSQQPGNAMLPEAEVESPLGRMENKFENWYARRAQIMGLNLDPDDPAHHYDYRAAYEAGVEPTQNEEGKWKWPSQFKKPTHPDRYVDGVDTISGYAVDSPEFEEVIANYPKGTKFLGPDGKIYKAKGPKKKKGKTSK